MERACHWSTPGLGEGGRLTVRGGEGRASPPDGRHQGGQPVHGVHQVGAGVADLGQVGEGGHLLEERRVDKPYGPRAALIQSSCFTVNGISNQDKDHSYLLFP